MAFKGGVVLGPVSLNATGSGTTNIAGTSNSGTVSIGNGSSAAVTIGCGTAGISVGTTANAHTSTFGSTNSTSSTTIQSGSGALTLTTNGGNANIVLTPNGTGVVTTANALRSASVSFDGGTNILSNYINTTSFTPVLSFGGGSTGITYSSQIGRYTRIGNVVFMYVSIILTNKGSSTGNMSISLPNAVVPLNSTPATLRFNAITFSGYAGALISTTPTLVVETTTSGGTPTIITDTAFTNSSFIQAEATLIIA